MVEMRGTSSLTVWLLTAILASFTVLLPPMGTAQISTDPANVIPDAFTFLFFPSVTYGSGYSNAYPMSLATGDLNGDGKLDLVLLSCSSPCNEHSSISIFLGNDDGTFRLGDAYNTSGFYATSVAVADVNADGKLDLVVANCGGQFDCFGTGLISVLLGRGDGTFQATVDYLLAEPFANSVVVADVNGDGNPDVLVASGGCHVVPCPIAGTVSVLLGNGDGTFRKEVPYFSGGSMAKSVAVSDVNTDGRLDLALANCNIVSAYCDGKGSVALLLGNGDGTFQEATTYDSGGVNAVSVTVADVNQDGRPDLVVTNQFSYTLGVLLGNVSGSFQPALTYDTRSQFSLAGASSVIAVDVNDDRNVDLVVAEDGAGVLLGNGDGTFQPVVTYNPGHGAEGVAVGDLNGDRRPDLAVAGLDGVGVLLNNNGAPETRISLVANPNPVTINQVVTYTAAVTPISGGIVQGEVVFVGSRGSATLNENQATIQASYAYPGSLPVTAIFPGNLNSASASISNTIIENVRGTSKTVVTTSGSPSQIGYPVTFTAAVTSKYGTIPNGDIVTFADGSTVLGSVALSGGKALYTISALAGGGHQINAAYRGDNTFAPSSGTVHQMVSLRPTTTSLLSTPNPSTYGTLVTLRAHVIITSSTPPTGKVTFKNGLIVLGGVIVDTSGTAILTKKTLAVGANSLTTTYGGDAVNGKSTSPPVIQAVNQAQITMILSSSLNPSKLGQLVKFTCVLSSNGGVPNGETVTFSYNGNPMGTSKISGGKASLTSTILPIGNNVVTANYEGDAGYSSATASITQVVQ